MPRWSRWSEPMKPCEAAIDAALLYLDKCGLSFWGGMPVDPPRPYHPPRHHAGVGE